MSKELQRNIEGKTFLVTGGAGFVGSNMVVYLLKCGAKVIALDNFLTGTWDNLDEYKNHENLTLCEGSVENISLLKHYKDVDYIIHLAASCLSLSTHNVYSDFYANIKGTINVLEISKYYNITMVYSSSTSVYGVQSVIPTPENVPLVLLSPYAVSKLAGEHYCLVYYRLWKTPVTVVRYSNVYGPRQTLHNPYCGVVSKFINGLLKDGKVIIYSDGLQTRDYTYIEDAIEGTLLALFYTRGEVFNIGTGVETSVIDLLKTIEKVIGKKAVIDYQEKRDIDNVRRRCVNIDQIKIKLNWEPKTRLIEGIRKTVEYFKCRSA